MPMIVYTTEDAYTAFVAGRITRREFFDVCARNAEQEVRTATTSLVCWQCGGNARFCACDRH